MRCRMKRDLIMPDVGSTIYFGVIFLQYSESFRLLLLYDIDKRVWFEKTIE